MTAFARLDDPATSLEAAATVEVTHTQAGVLYVIRSVSYPLTDENICAIYNSIQDVLDFPPASESSIRTRRVELERKGLVWFAGYDVNRGGRRVRTWRA